MKKIDDSVWREMSTDARYEAAMLLLDIPIEQMLRVADLLGMFSIEGRAVGYMGRCGNGCCVNVQEAGMDETCWSVNRQLVIEKYDKYGNTLEELPL